MDRIVVTHGGVGAKEETRDGPEKAAARGMAALGDGATCLDASVEASVVLEDDPRFNAGTGSRIRLDGASVEMDASLMTSDGLMGAVAALQRVKNPIRVARLVCDTPHVLLAGAGAEAYARRHGVPVFDPTTDQAREFYRRACKKLGEGTVSTHYRRWLDFDHYDMVELGCDTIGAVVADGRGGFAAANSTGGSALMLPGRLGDSCHYGAGLWAGPAGAVATTGIGEFVIAKLMARYVYDRMVDGLPCQAACEAGVALYTKEIPVGVIAVSPSGWGAAANLSMPTGTASESS